jgi:hypothetical protein
MPDSIAAIQSNPLLSPSAGDLASNPPPSRPADQVGHEPTHAADPGRAADAPPAKSPATAASANEPAPTPLGNTRFRYLIDAKTHALTVVMLDSTTHEVVRTIPEDELKHLSRGDLLEFWA